MHHRRSACVPPEALTHLVDVLEAALGGTQAPPAPACARGAGGTGTRLPRRRISRP